MTAHLYMRMHLFHGVLWPVHADWHGECVMKATARDLKSAYKQIPLNETDVNKAVVSIFDPTSSSQKFFILKIGASASVLHFNRVNNLPWAIADLERSTLGAAKAMFLLMTSC